jgi:hypothetical protein
MWGTGKISVCESQQENPIITNPNKARIVQNFTQILDSLMYLRYKMQLKDIIFALFCEKCLFFDSTFLYF